MLEIILGIFGSGGFGSLLGLVGGYFNRKLDIEVKKLDIQDRVADRANELIKLEKEAQIVEVEGRNKIHVATVEADSIVESAGYAAMAKSYDFARTTAEDGLVDKFSKMVRPFLTLAFFAFSIAIFVQVTKYVYSLQLPMDPAAIMKLWVLIIEWVLFQSGVCIGWWFAMRPGKPAQTVSTN